jgi:hypothetical protein
MKIKYYIIIVAILQSLLISSQDSFEFIVLPDTQTYMEEFPEVFMKQMQWIAQQDNRFSFVLHEGDITQNNSEKEWEIAREGFALIDGKIPYNLSLGNHDMGSEAGKFADIRNTKLANNFFDHKDYVKQSKSIATFPKDSIDNNCAEYHLLNEKWIVFSLEFGPRNKVIDWASALIKKHPDHNVIFNTHSYMYNDNTLQGGDDWYLPQKYGIGKDTGENAVNDGGDLWEKLIKKHKNIVMVFSGHILGAGVGQLVSKNDFGTNVYQMLANYQKNVKGVEKGDSGYLRIIKVDKKSKSISVKTYSPWLDNFRTEPDHEFTFSDVKI